MPGLRLRFHNSPDSSKVFSSSLRTLWAMSVAR